jgi:hypothetical protein
VEHDERTDTDDRDELWLSLRALRIDIDRLAAGDYDGSDRQRQILTLLARIVAAEIDFREARAKE